MKRKLITGLLAFIASTSYGQDVAYSFKGNLDQGTILKLENDCRSIVGVQTVKVRYKEDSERGEILFDLVKLGETRTEGSNQEFSPVAIKTLLIENGLEPLDYRTINK